MKAQKSSSRVVEIEIAEATHTETSSTTKSISATSASISHSAKNGQNGRGKDVSLKGINLFGPQYHYESADGEGLGDGNPVAKSDFKSSDTYIFDSHNMLADTDQWEFYHQIFERIDSQLMFDSILAQYNHFGSVFLEFEVDAEGHFVETALRAKADDPILKVHVIRALRKGLKESFVKAKWNPSGKTAVLQAKFEFLYGDSSVNSKKQKEFGKPVLVFKRATSEKPTASNLTDTLLDADNLKNPYQIAERIEKYKKKKALRAGDFDPFQNYRNDPDYDL